MARASVMQWSRVTELPAFPKPTQPMRCVDPIRLQPIPWGTRDEALARGICRHIVDATPPTVIPCNPITEARMRRHLRCMHISHH